jgi:crotonobetainyl-CoA:carnitine CoA-transferase CaiB-like acyl-CoA transferase
VNCARLAGEGGEPPGISNPRAPCALLTSAGVHKSALENIDMAQPQAQHVLSGYRVLDFSQYIAGPTVTRMMAEMGAEVIKVEMAPNGDQTRGMPYLKDNRSGYFVQQNLGKKSLCIDIRKAAGLDIIKQLIPRMDVVVENFGPGTIKRLGLGYEVVKALNPKIVMCSVSTFGQDGPLATQPGWDFIGACYSGVLDMVGERDQTPVFPGLAIGDTSTGVHALAAVACALLYRERTGMGQHLDVSLLDSYFTSAPPTTWRPSRSADGVATRAPISMHWGRSSTRC